MPAKKVAVAALVIGSGPAGGTAALYLARAGLKPVVLTGETPGGQLTLTTAIENFPGWTGTGPDLVEKIQKQATEAGATYEPYVVTKCDLKANPKVLSTDMDVTYEAKVVVVATGAAALWLNVPGEQKLKGRGVSGCATCDGSLFKGKRVIVVGGGDAALEDALSLVRYCSSVKLIHRRAELRASKAMQAKFFAAQPKIEALWDSTVVECVGDKALTAVKVKNLKTGAVTQVPCDGLFVAVGHKPATDFLGGQLELGPGGYIITKDGPATSVPGVFAAGDCADRVYRQAITSAGSGCQAALLAEKYLEGLGVGA